LPPRRPGPGGRRQRGRARAFARGAKGARRRRQRRCCREDAGGSFAFPAASAGRGLPPHSFRVRPGAGSVEARPAACAMRWRLTRRQRDVLRRLLDGKTNKVIAADLGTEEGTVELHVTALLRKVGAENRSELIARFWREPF